MNLLIRVFCLLEGFCRAALGMCGTALWTVRLPEGGSARQLMSYAVNMEGVMTW